MMVTKYKVLCREGVQCFREDEFDATNHHVSESQVLTLYQDQETVAVYPHHGWDRLVIVKVQTDVEKLKDRIGEYEHE